MSWQGRYICSSAADGPKPVLSLLEDYWKIWVSQILSSEAHVVL